MIVQNKYTTYAQIVRLNFVIEQTSEKMYPLILPMKQIVFLEEQNLS